MRAAWKWLSVPVLLPNLLVGFPVFAADDEPELSPEKVGKIEFQQEEAADKVRQQFGNRKLSEMTQDERKDFSAQQREAAQKVLENNGVSNTSYAHFTAHMNEDDRRAARDASKKAERDDVRKEVKAEPGEADAQVVPFDPADRSAVAPSAKGINVPLAPPPASRSKRSGSRRKRSPSDS